MAGTLLFNALKEAIDEEMANDVNVCVMGKMLVNMEDLIR